MKKIHSTIIILALFFFELVSFYNLSNSIEGSLISLFIALIIGINLVMIFAFLMNKKTKKIETKFLLIGALIGITYMFAIPMMKGTDEIPHLYRVLEISEGQIIKQKKAAEIPKNVYDYADPRDLSFYHIDTILETTSKEKVSLEGTRIPSSYPPT